MNVCHASAANASVPPSRLVVSRTTDEAVCEDGELFDRLSGLQDRWQQETLARHGVIQR